MTLDAHQHALVDPASAEAPKQKSVPSTEKTAPENGAANQSVFQRISSGVSAMRRRSIQAVPAFIVNHSSNLLGAAHVGTEMMMFKASNKDGRLVQNPNNPINWIKEPLQTVFFDTFKRSRSQAIPVGELLKGNPFKNIYKRITDVEAATLRVQHNSENADKTLSEIKLSNPWQTRSTLAGLIIWSLSALIPERPDDPAEIERMAIKRKTNPVGYVGERLKQAVWVPDWGNHKRQMVGLGYVIIGLCSSIGAWRGRTKDPLTNLQKYTFNRSYLATSLLSLGASVPLLFASDDQRGYGGFGAIMMGRIPFLFGSIGTKYRDKEPGRQWYAASMLSFQAENFAQTMVGGAEVTFDAQGQKIIKDHAAIREEAKAKAKVILTHAKPSNSATFDKAPELIGDDYTPQSKIEAGVISEKALPAPANENRSAANDNPNTYAEQQMQRRAEPGLAGGITA